MRQKLGKFSLSLKSFDEDGTFHGYASVFDVVDTQGEEVARGAFQKSIDRWKGRGRLPKMLWQHDMRHPIGVWEQLTEDETGLFVKGKLLLDVAACREAYSLLRAGVVDGLSIGFVTIRSRHNSLKKCRLLEEIELHEISLVTFAANAEARVTGYKVDDLWEDEILGRLSALETVFREGGFKMT